MADNGAVRLRGAIGRRLRVSTSHGSRAAHPNRDSLRSSGPIGDRGAFVRLGRDHQPQCVSADVSAECAGLVTDFGRLKPGYIDGDAELDRWPVESAPWASAALQAFAAVLSVRRSWRRGRAGV